MLVLTRKQNEKVRIGDSITVTVLRMKGKGVRLGIEAPKDVNVIRGELCFDLEDDDVETPQQQSRSNPPREESFSARKQQSSTDYWPRREECRQTDAVGVAVDCTSPLKAMVDARTL